MKENRHRIGRLMRTVTLAAVLLVVLVLAGTASAEPTAGLILRRSVIGGGGGQSAASGHRLSGTIGQAVTGVRETPSHTLCSGFWCGLGRYEIYLPLVLRGL